MIDIGVNLTSARFEKDRAEVIERAKSNNITSMLVTGTSVAESQRALSLCQNSPNYLYCTAGVHPHDADNVSSDYIDQLRSLSKNDQVKAIGECGLDFNRNFSTPENQTRVFAEQIALASELKLPLFLHQRDAFSSWFELLRPYIDKVPAMVSHCFTGNKEELIQCIEHGMYIGITGWVCDERRGQELRDIVKFIPLDRLMIETDAPYLTPRNIRPRPKSSRNEPSFLPYIVKELAIAMDVAEKEIVTHSLRNSELVFGIGELND